MTNPLRARAAASAGLFLALLLVAACQAGPKATVEQFYRAVANGNVNEAADLFSSRITRTLGREKLVQGLALQTRRIKDAGGIKSIDVLEEDVVGETARVRVRMTLNQGQPMTETVNLIREQGAWRIDTAGK